MLSVSSRNGDRVVRFDRTNVHGRIHHAREAGAALIHRQGLGHVGIVIQIEGVRRQERVTAIIDCEATRTWQMRLGRPAVVYCERTKERIDVQLIVGASNGRAICVPQQAVIGINRAGDIVRRRARAATVEVS
jgi:hypothetical protein